MSDGSLMHAAERLVNAVRRQHGEGIEGFMALACAIAGVAASIEPKPRAIGGGRRRIKRRKTRRAEKAKPPIAPEAQKEIPSKPAAPPKPASTSAPAAKPASQAAGVLTGIIVRLEPGAEAIEVRGKTMEISARQAQLLALLAAGAPAPIDRRFLISKLWPPGHVPTFADQLLGTLATECRAAAAAVGLDIKTVRGRRHRAAAGR